MLFDWHVFLLNEDYDIRLIRSQPEKVYRWYTNYRPILIKVIKKLHDKESASKTKSLHLEQYLPRMAVKGLVIQP